MLVEARKLDRALEKKEEKCIKGEEGRPYLIPRCRDGDEYWVWGTVERFT